MKNQRVAYFLSHPIQYFSPLLKAMAKECDLHVYYFSDASIKGSIDKGFGRSVQWDAPLLEGYNYKFLKNYSRRPSLDNHFFDIFNPGIIKILKKEKASVVIVNGWTYSSTLMTIFFARICGKKVWLRAENPLNQELNKNKKILLLKRLFLKNFLFKFFISKCLYIGSESKLFFEFYGVPVSKLIYTPYAVENLFFSEQYSELKNNLNEIRKQLGLPTDKLIILFSGKYITKKRPLDILQAFLLLNNNNYALVMVGEGELRKEMENFILKNNLKNVYLTGFINQSVIPKYYAVADVFVMCSGVGETWGLSVNEAMNFKKAVIVSKTCGCCPDLVQQGENGFAFEEGNIKALAAYLRTVLNNQNFRTSAGEKSSEIVRGFSISQIVKNLMASLN